MFQEIFVSIQPLYFVACSLESSHMTEQEKDRGGIELYQIVCGAIDLREYCFQTSIGRICLLYACKGILAERISL